MHQLRQGAGGKFYRQLSGGVLAKGGTDGSDFDRTFLRAYWYGDGDAGGATGVYGTKAEMSYIDREIDSNHMEFGSVEGWLWISASVHEGKRTVMGRPGEIKRYN